MSAARLEADKERLRALCAEVDAAKSESEALYERRDALLRRLKAKGVPRSELLALSGMSTSAMKWVLGDGRARRAAG